MGGDTLKFCLSNAKPSASLRQLVTMQASRHFVERAFEDAKSACGMADYQVRGWLAWHHHMARVRVAHLFLAKERLAVRDSHRFLSCPDIVAMLRQKFPQRSAPTMTWSIPSFSVTDDGSTPPSNTMNNKALPHPHRSER